MLLLVFVHVAFSGSCSVGLDAVDIQIVSVRSAASLAPFSSRCGPSLRSLRRNFLALLGGGFLLCYLFLCSFFARFPFCDLFLAGFLGYLLFLCSLFRPDVAVLLRVLVGFFEAVFLAAMVSALKNLYKTRDYTYATPRVKGF
jgi:hypothetical protein